MRIRVKTPTNDEEILLGEVITCQGMYVLFQSSSGYGKQRAISYRIFTNKSTR